MALFKFFVFLLLPSVFANESSLTSLDLRSQNKWALHGSVSPLDFWIPGKFGLSAAYVPSADATWELEYLRGAMSLKLIIDDLGKMTEEKISFLRRFYSDRNSFNFFLGGTYHNFRAQIGRSLISYIPNTTIPNADLVRIKTLGILGGLGNRWQFESGLSIGVDWISLAIPVSTLQADAPYLKTNANQSAKDEIDDVRHRQAYPRIDFV